MSLLSRSKQTEVKFLAYFYRFMTLTKMLSFTRAVFTHLYIGMLLAPASRIHSMLSIEEAQHSAVHRESVQPMLGINISLLGEEEF